MFVGRHPGAPEIVDRRGRPAAITEHDINVYVHYPGVDLSDKRIYDLFTHLRRPGLAGRTATRDLVEYSRELAAQVSALREATGEHHRSIATLAAFHAADRARLDRDELVRELQGLQASARDLLNLVVTAQGSMVATEELDALWLEMDMQANDERRERDLRQALSAQRVANSPFMPNGPDAAWQAAHLFPKQYTDVSSEVISQCR